MRALFLTVGCLALWWALDRFGKSENASLASSYMLVAGAFGALAIMATTVYALVR